jgi:hypothetical protein
MKQITIDTIRKITGKAVLKFSLIDHSIIGFTVTGNKTAACKKLVNAGYDAQQIGYGFIKIKNVQYV